jgi:hypothetical protein
MATPKRIKKPAPQIDLNAVFNKDSELADERQKAGHEFDMKLLEAAQKQRTKKRR